MPLSEEEKANAAEKEKTTRQKKKEEQERILRELAGDRELYEARHVKAQPVAPPAPKVLIRVRYDIDGKQGRKPVDIEGTPATISLLHFYQKVEEEFKVEQSRQIWHPADEASFPVKPQQKSLPSWNSFSSPDEFPSFQELGLRNGQELFLTVAPQGAAPAPTQQPKDVPQAVRKSSQSESDEDGELAEALRLSRELVNSNSHDNIRDAAVPTQPPAPIQPEAQRAAPSRQPAAPAPTNATSSFSSGDTAGAVQYKDEARMKFLWRKIEEKKLSIVRAREMREAEEVHNVHCSPETAMLAGLLLWSDSETDFYARLRCELDRTVGLEPVKEFIVQRLRDAAGRHVLKEGKQPSRHVLLSGAFGTGKKYGAELIGRLFSLLSSNLSAKVRLNARVRLAAQFDPENRGALLTRNDMGIVVEDFGSSSRNRMRVQGPSGRFGNYREDELVAEPEVLIKLDSLGKLVDQQTGKIKAPDNSCFFLQLLSPLTDAESTILDGVQAVGSIVVIAGLPDIVDSSLQISAFRRKQPDILSLQTLSPNDVAQLIARAVEKKGYEGVGEGDVGTIELVTVLEHIIRQRFDESLIRQKNSHLAQDVLELAISRKNDRTWEDSLDAPERFRLTPADFGLDALTAEQRERRLQEVEAEVNALVGWGSSEEPGTPRHFFETIQRQLGRGSGGARPAVNVAHNLPKALSVSANAGVGRETFVQLAARFLRACGSITREEVVWMDGVEIAAAGAAAEPDVTARLASANRGCLAIRDMDALADNREACRALVMALEMSEASSSTLLVSIGSPAAMARIARMEPALEARFATRIQIPDFTATELVLFVEQAAQSLPSGALSLEADLAPALANHINEVYGGGHHGKELGERGNLGLARQLLQRAVQNRITRLFNSIQSGDRPDDSPESALLTVADFEIGAPLGEGAEQKAAIDEEVNNLIGMDKAKEWFQTVRQKVAFVEQTGTRSDLRVCLNIIITGNPGTGKTTFARILAKFFHTYGVLTKDSFVEKNGLELKAEYMGGTAPRVKSAVKEAMGGCLFLDEAYALVDSTAGIGSSGDAFSQEAMRTLLTEVENNRTNLMVVLAGYKDKMNRLMRAEEGLSRRFPNRLHLDDYTPEELAKICSMVSRTRMQRDFEPGLEDKLARHIENFYWRDIKQQNAGLSLNLTEQALDRQIIRIVEKHPGAFSFLPVASRNLDRQTSGNDATPKLLKQRSALTKDQIKEEVEVFTASDFGIEERPTLGDPELRARVQEEVDMLTGMSNVKHFFEEMKKSVYFVERGGDPKVLQTSLNLRLTGNPGTGKTTVARLISRFLYAHGVLPHDRFVEKNALMLKGQFVGQTAPSVVEAVRDAMGGCLFIDEAYALADRGGDKFSGEVVRTLLTEVENHRTGLLVVLAGYADKMETLMDSDPGLRRRFSLELRLVDYSPEELSAICESFANNKLKLTFEPDLREKLANHIRFKHGSEIHQHNGGLAVTLAERAFRRLATRLGDPNTTAAISGPAARMLTAEDFEIRADCGSVPREQAEGPPAAGAGAKHSGADDSAAPPPPKRGRSSASSSKRELVGSLAKEIAAQLLLAVDSIGDDDDD